MTTTTPPRQIEIGYDDGYSESKPQSVYVFGHDLTDDEARALAQAELDTWVEEHDWEDERPLVTIAVRTWLQREAVDPDNDEGFTHVFVTHSTETAGASAVIEFEVDEHLMPRCEVEGCGLRWFSGNEQVDPRRMCQGHSAVRNARTALLHTLGQAHQAAEYAMGYPHEHFDAPGLRSTLSSPRRRREYAVSHAAQTGEDLTQSIALAAAELQDAEAKGFTLKPWRFSFGEWNQSAPKPVYVETLDALETLPVRAIVRGRYGLIAERTSGVFWSQIGTLTKTRSDALFQELGPRFEVVSAGA